MPDRTRRESEGKGRMCFREEGVINSVSCGCGAKRGVLSTDRGLSGRMTPQALFAAAVGLGAGPAGPRKMGRESTDRASPGSAPENPYCEETAEVSQHRG